MSNVPGRGAGEGTGNSRATEHCEHVVGMCGTSGRDWIVALMVVVQKRDCCRLKSLQWGEDVSQERIRERGLDDDGQEDAATSKRLCCRVGPRGSYIYVQLRLLPVPACKVQTMYFLSGDYRSTHCTAVGGMHCYHALRRPCISQNPILQLDPELAPRISGDPADP